MKIEFKGEFKSLKDFEWDNVPDFAVITGKNGTGKSQLLELIYVSITESRPPSELMTITGTSYKKSEISFLKSDWVLNNSAEVSLMTLQQDLKDLYGNLQQRHNFHGQPRLKFLYDEIFGTTGGGGILPQFRKPNTLDEFESKFPLEFLRHENELTQQIGRIFVDYNISRIETLAQGKTEDETVREIGPKPWVVLNEIMKSSHLPFEFNDPENTGIKRSFKLAITDTIQNTEIQFSELSSGEKVLVSLVFYLYTSQKDRHFPKFLLLDEPDAHLHPSMTKQFLNVIEEVFVKQHGIRVIMTTHSPSTVALSPEDSLYVMSKSVPRISKSSSKNETIALLTEGLVIVGTGTKYFIVEDNDDVNFYQETYSFMVSKGLLTGGVPYVFIPASTSSKSGGKAQVYEWVSKLSSSGLNDIIHGIIDLDSGNPPAPGIHVLPRYSFENYLLDPINVYAALMDSNTHPKIAGIDLNIGEEYKLKTLTAEQLQSIADHIHASVQATVASFFPGFNANENDLETITIDSGQQVKYPKWLLNRKGKSLMNDIYLSKFPRINFASLSKAHQKIHIVPSDFSVWFGSLAS